MPDFKLPVKAEQPAHWPYAIQACFIVSLHVLFTLIKRARIEPTKKQFALDLKNFSTHSVFFNSLLVILF